MRLPARKMLPSVNRKEGARARGCSRPTDAVPAQPSQRSEPIYLRAAVTLSVPHFTERMPLATLTAGQFPAVPTDGNGLGSGTAPSHGPSPVKDLSHGAWLPPASRPVADLYHFRHKDSTTALHTGSTVWNLVLFDFGGSFCSHLLSRPQAFQRQELLSPTVALPHRAWQVSSCSPGSRCCLVAAPCACFGGLTLQQPEDVFLQG